MRRRRVVTRSYASVTSAALVVLCTAATGALADDLPSPVVTKDPAAAGNASAMTMGSHGDHNDIPAGVHGAAMVGAGQFMVSYTPSLMGMAGNYIGSNRVSPDTIVTTIPVPGMMAPAMGGMGMGGMTPQFYRIVPQSMFTDMQMLHAMYGVTNWLDLMVMANYTTKSMTMTTYAGMSGTKVLGSSTASTEGFGDTITTSLWRLYDDPINHVHLNLGLSLPSGSTTDNVNMLSPMGAMMTMRANYGMQLGTGTVDFAPGLTYTGHLAQWSWGAAYRGRFPLDNNAEGYRYGNFNDLTAWGGYTWIPGVTTTFRADANYQDNIHGADALITGLMQGTNPLFYGGTHVNLFGGVEFDCTRIGMRNTHLAIEGGAPVYQNLNGPQLGQDWQVNLALRVGM
jgi:hypothetical protein